MTMECCKCKESIPKYNVIIYRKKLYHKKCLPGSQQVTEIKEVVDKPETKKPRVRKRLKKNMKKK